MNADNPFPDPNHRDNKPAAARGGGNKIRNHDRRAKGLQPRRRRTVCLSPQLDQVVMNEVLRRGLPSASALIEEAVEKEVRHRSEPEELNVAEEMRQLRLAVHRFERDSAERDVVQVELIAGLARTQFATFPQPDEAERATRIAEAKLRFERFIDAVGRQIESGKTTLSQLPDLPAVDPAAEPSDAENISSTDEAGEGVSSRGV